jgi:hypothetical protein
LPPSCSKVNLVELVTRSLALREQHVAKQDGHRGYRRPILAKGPTAVVRYGHAYYEGPGMERLTLEQLRTRMGGDER